MTTLYAIWATVTLAAIAFCWRRDVIRLRNQARAFDALRHPAGGRFATHDAIGNVTEVAGVGMGELLRRVRPEVDDAGVWR